jgi:hypothetical protein
LNNEQTFQKITDFLTEIGIYYKLTTIEEDTFLSGLKINAGILLIDKAKCTYYGDILHEAGHIAVLTPEERYQKKGDLGTGVGENAVILWSYAATLFINIPSSVVFHGNGYQDNSDRLIEEFSNENYIGLSSLQWFGMTCDEQNAELQGVEPFPHMMHWLRA